MMRGATPAVAPPRMRAIGVRPYFLAAASEAMISAAAPSLTPDALPAVTVPPSRNGVGSLASASTVVPARGCSSLATTTGVALALRDRHRRDLLRQPAVGLRGDRLVLAAHREGVLVGARHLKILGDVLAGLRHGIDAVLLLHQRVDEAPADRRVVDLGVARKGAPSAFGMTKGARDIDSTPPAIISSASPALMARAAMITASMPEPHSRLIVVPGHLLGQAGQQQRHARDVAVVLAGLVGAAEDDVVDRLPVDATALRAISAFSGMAPRSSGRTDDSAPPKRPIGVRM